MCLVISLGSEFLYLINPRVRKFVQFRCKRLVRGFFLRYVLMAEEQIPHPVVVLPADVPVPEEPPAAPPAAVPDSAPAVENPANVVDAATQEVIVRQFKSSFTPKISLFRFLASLFLPNWLFLVGFPVSHGRCQSMLSPRVYRAVAAVKFLLLWLNSFLWQVGSQ